MKSTRMHVLLVSALFAFGAFGPKAQASAVLELIPDNPGPYFGGESLTVDVWLHSQVSRDATLSDIQLDFSDTDPALALDQTFMFDFTTVPDPYGTDPQLPVPYAWNHIKCGCPELFLLLPADGSLHVGSLGVDLPGGQGMYTLDAVNADEPNTAFGAELRCHLGECSVWRAHTGDITGGVYDFQVIPEPATLSLLMVGAAGVVYRWRGARRSLGAICTLGGVARV